MTDLREVREQAGDLAVAQLLCDSWFGVTELAEANELSILEALQSGTHADRIQFNQDYFVSGQTVDGLSVVAAENQGCWLAVRREGDKVEFGLPDRDRRWSPSASVSMSELLVRMLAQAAVFADGALMGSVDESHLQPWELLPELEVGDDPAIVPTVLAGPGWFGIELGLTAFLPSAVASIGLAALNDDQGWQAL